MAHKKGQGSSRNGRDSNPQYRGVKAYGGQRVTSGSIIVRQVGTPVVEGAVVEATVLGEVKGKKLVVFHKRRRKYARRRNGHRQAFTDVKVERIG